MERLIMFYGTECKHCHAMIPVVEKLEKEEKVKIERIETWHNSKNEALRKKYDDGCGGVPFFCNEKTKKTICGEVPYSKLKEWAIGR